MLFKTQQVRIALLLVTIVVVTAGNEFESAEYFSEVLKATELPKFIVNQEIYLKNSKALYEKFNRNSLTIAWLREHNINATLKMLDHILWRIHFKDIFVIFETEQGNNFNDKQLMALFQGCWHKGFISVLLWHQEQLYTYHPYPKIKTIQLQNVQQYMDKTHLNNYQQYSCPMPFFDFPNLCFSYRNRQGKLVRTGYYCKWVQLYLDYYNASIDHIFIDMWTGNYTQLEAINILNELGFCLLPIFLSKSGQYFERSEVLHLTRVNLMVPSANEISASSRLAL
ncbi:hypothetical protein FF38_06774 [Lucilia cuprina]|uniref:Uncharacterized protein n=1 Tax=Lucilia cuprina TaxID=7375 RepID=A0A0L0CR76_LUCCU|nr:hypothetical protein FF38_06774 [Lucilia cuprina]